MKFVPRTMRMTESEYRANIQGLNVVFGAVLGFVLAGAEAMSNYQFGIVLLLSTTIVVTIFYLEASSYRVFYGLLAVALIALLPRMMQAIAEVEAPEKLQPTLAVWLAMVAVMELAPREKTPRAGAD